MSMSDRFGSGRTAVAALAICILLLADPLAMVSAPAAAAEPAGVDAIEPPSGEPVACVSGFGDTSSKVAMALHGVTLTGAGAIAVGFMRRSGVSDLGRRRPAAIYNSDERWRRVHAGSPGDEDGLVAVTAADDDDAWAVGFTRIDLQTMPLAMRWNGRKWIVNRPKPRGSTAALFTDVTMLEGGDPFAVGYRMTANGKREPIAARKDGRRWRYLSPRIGKHESMSLTGVAPDGQGGIWVVGQGGQGAEIGPVIYRRDRAIWTRMKTPRLKGEAVLADVVAAAADDGWAVGYQRVNGRSVPLVMHWDGTAWQDTTAPQFDSADVLLTAVSAAPTGGIWVVGTAWNAETIGYEAVAAWWDGQAWNEVSGRDGGTELHDVVGALDADGWAVGRSGQLARTTRVCTPSQSGIFGGSEPSQPGPLADELAAGEVESAIAPAGDGAAAAGQATSTDAAAEAYGDTAIVAAKRDTQKKARAAKQSKSKAAKSERRTRQATLSRLVARNVAREAGLSDLTATYGAVVADFDGDGVDDLYIGRHGRKGRLALNRDGVFVDHAAMRFPVIDRHGCAAADIDGSGLPDLYCAIGGKRGSGLKANELWIDPGGDGPRESSVERGVSDPTGRGRHAVLLESEGSHAVDLLVTNSPTRVDGLPSIGRLYRTKGDGTFSARARTGFAPRLGSLGVHDADFDNDGREDLLLVTGGLQAPRQEGTRLYRNTRRGLVDVTSQMGIRSFGEVDAELVDLDRNGKLDLVQLSPTKLRVSRLQNGKFRKIYERKLTYGRAIAGGDANADGRDDLYIVRSNGSRNLPDIMLINRKLGRAWDKVSIPQVSAGDGDDAVAIDHDGNGHDDFLVLNGRNQRGPIELVAFYKR